MESQDTNPTKLASRAKQVINDIIYITLATSDKNGQPWNSPVYSAFDENYNFYWISWKQNQHSQNIQENNKTFAVIYDSTSPEGEGFGVYMKGKAKQLKITDAVTIAKALTLLYSRKKKKLRKPEEFVGVLPRRIYQFSPEQIWVNAEGNINGHFVDSRIDMTKELLRP